MAPDVLTFGATCTGATACVGTESAPRGAGPTTGGGPEPGPSSGGGAGAVESTGPLAPPLPRRCNSLRSRSVITTVDSSRVGSVTSPPAAVFRPRAALAFSSGVNKNPSRLFDGGGRADGSRGRPGPSRQGHTYWAPEQR